MGAAAFTDYELGRSDQFYRFSVKCDRAMNARLQDAAREAGVSVTTLVQRHFETILDEPADDTGFSPDVFARKHGISVQAARLWKALSSAADGQGFATCTLHAIGAVAKVSQGRAGEYLGELVGIQLVRIIKRAASKFPGTYQIMQPKIHSSPERILP